MNHYIKKYITKGLNKYKVSWAEEHNGGGMLHGEEYPAIISTLYPGRIFENCFEWCSGPGFIGYNILDHGLCKNLVFTDIHKPVLDLAALTAKENNLVDKVKIYHGGTIDVIPKGTKIDLVVSNPPHFSRLGVEKPNRLFDDPNWDIHRLFFKYIGDYLTDDGIILLQENGSGSGLGGVFEGMIKENGFKITDVIKSPGFYKDTKEDIIKRNGTTDIHQSFLDLSLQYYLEVQRQ